MGSYALDLCLIGQNREAVHPPCLVNGSTQNSKEPMPQIPTQKNRQRKKISKTATELDELDMSKAPKMVMSNFVIKVSLGCHRNTQVPCCIQLFILLSMLDSIRGDKDRHDPVQGQHLPVSPRVTSQVQCSALYMTFPRHPRVS